MGSMCAFVWGGRVDSDERVRPLRSWTATSNEHLSRPCASASAQWNNFQPLGARV